MSTSKPISFRLQAGQQFSSCSVSKSCGNQKTTAKDRDGDLVIELDNGVPVNATFYYPNISECTESLLRTCDLVAIFKDNELDALVNSSSDLQIYREVLARNNESSPKQSGTEYQDSGAINPLDPPINDSNPNPPYFLFGVPVLLIALFFLFRVFRLPSSTNTRQARSTEIRQVTAYGQTLQPNATQLASPAITDKILRQLSAMQSQINQLSIKLGNLETELLVMSQKFDSAKPMVSPALLTQALPLTPVPITAPQRQLDISLIKEAVATANYDLIKNFPHDFVTETLDSRQGKEDRVRFSIDGNHETSQQRAQSEFIAVPYLNQTYLIPNILPNATDPSRTIKRHVDRNKVYRGDGQNLLSLSEVATVERSGDSYVLAKPGRIG